MNVTTNAQILNADTNGGAAGSVVLTLDDILPMWGEGETRTEAIHDLVMSIGEVLSTLRESRGNMAPHLEEELFFLERLEWEFRNRDDGSVTFP